MPKEEIVEGLRAAVAKGESLNRAMMSFYNSGYSKQDIEAAARLLENPQLPSVKSVQAGMRQPMQAQPTQVVRQAPVQPKPQLVQPTPPPVQPKPQPTPAAVEKAIEVFERQETRQIVEPVKPGAEEHYVPQPTYPHVEEPQRAYASLQQQQPIQRISNYDGRPSPASAIMIFILVFILLVLIGSLISVFLFKDELSGFFGSLL